MAGRFLRLKLSDSRDSFKYLFRVLLFVKLGSIQPNEAFSPEEALHNLADVEATDVAVGRDLSLCQ